MDKTRWIAIFAKEKGKVSGAKATKRLDPFNRNSALIYVRKKIPGQ